MIMSEVTGEQEKIAFVLLTSTGETAIVQKISEREKFCCYFLFPFSGNVAVWYIYVCVSVE